MAAITLEDVLDYAPELHKVRPAAWTTSLGFVNELTVDGI